MLHVLAGDAQLSGDLFGAQVVSTGWAHPSEVPSDEQRDALVSVIQRAQHTDIELLRPPVGTLVAAVVCRCFDQTQIVVS